MCPKLVKVVAVSEPTTDNALSDEPHMLTAADKLQ
jgi:hypothetical protein